MSKNSYCCRCGAVAENDLCMECAIRERWANEQKRMTVAKRTDGATGATYLAKKAANIRKREDVEAAQLIADAIERKHATTACDAPIDAPTEAGKEEPKGKRGRKPPTEKEWKRRRQLRDDWIQFKEVNPELTKSDFCKDRPITVKELNRVLACLRAHKNRE